MTGDGTHEYVAGYVWSGDHKEGRIWKDGTLLYSQGPGVQGTAAYDVKVAGADVFTCGFEKEGGHTVAKVWKNGAVLYTLSDGARNACAEDVAFHEGKVYVAGWEEDENGLHRARVWQDGVPIPALAPAHGASSAKGIAASGPDVLVVGSDTVPSGR